MATMNQAVLTPRRTRSAQPFPAAAISLRSPPPPSPAFVKAAALSPTDFRRSPAAEATSRRRRACVAGEPRASGEGLGSRALAEGFEPPGRRNGLTGEEKRGGGSTANSGSGGGEATREEEGRGGTGRRREGTYGTVIWDFYLFIFWSRAGHVNSGCDWVIKLINFFSVVKCA